MDEARADAYNPSSLHAEGRRARARLDDARDRVAACLGVSRKEITFTGSGTEADNAAILGVVRASAGRVTCWRRRSTTMRCCTRSTRWQRGPRSTVCCRSTIAGRSTRPRLQRRCVPATIWPRSSTRTTKSARFRRSRSWLGSHASAACFSTPMPFKRPGGCLWTRRARSRSVVDLGAQIRRPEGGRRALRSQRRVAGTDRTRRRPRVRPALRYGKRDRRRRLGARARTRRRRPTERAERVARLRDRLESGIRSTIADVRINGSGGARLPGNSNVSFAGAGSEELLLQLDLHGVAVSAGSACTSGAIEPSHVIAALGIGPRWCSGPIRFSLGRTTTEEEIDRVLELLPGVVANVQGKESGRPGKAAALGGVG